MTTLFGDFSGGNNSNAGTSFALRFKNWSLGATAARTAPGDTIRWMKSPDPTAAGSFTWTNASRTITIPAGTILDITDCNQAWTAVGGNVTQAQSSTRMQGAQSTKFTVAVGFTTGQVAYYTLPSPLDCSAYQQLNLYIQPETASIAANTYRIDLCSDTLGANPIDSFTIDFALDPGSFSWHKFVSNKGSALGASIQSIAIVALLDPGTTNIYVDNIFVSKSTASVDCLTLHSLVSKTSAPAGTSADYWFAIQSITGTTLTIAGKSGTSPASLGLTYAGTTQTLTSYVRQPIVLALADIVSAVYNATKEAGTDGSPIAHSGGWNTTDMTTQTGETFVTAVACDSGAAFNIDHDYITVDKISCHFIGKGFGVNATNVSLTDCWAMNCNTSPFGLSSHNTLLTRCYGKDLNAAIFIGTGSIYGVTFNDCHAYGSTAGAGFSLGATNICNDCSAILNGGGGFQLISNSGDVVMLDRCSTEQNTSAGIVMTTTNVLGAAIGNNCSIAESTEVSIATANTDYRFYSDNHDDVDGACTIFGSRFRITKDASVRHTASGYSWKLSPTSSLVVANFPVKHLLASRVLVAGVAVAIKCWVRRDSQSITAKLVAPKYARVVTTEQSATASAANDTFEQLTINVTPAVTGPVEIYGYAYGGTTLSAYFDDVSFT